MTLASGSRVTASSRDKENSAVSNLVHLSRQLWLLKRSSSESHAPWGGVFRNPPEWEEEIDFRFQGSNLEHFSRIVLSMLEQEQLGVLHSCPFDFFP